MIVPRHVCDSSSNCVHGRSVIDTREEEVWKLIVTFCKIQIPQYSSVRVSQSAEKQTPSLWRGGWRTSKEINIKQSASNEQFKVKFGGDWKCTLVLISLKSRKRRCFFRNDKIQDRSSNSSGVTRYGKRWIKYCYQKHWIYLLLPEFPILTHDSSLSLVPDDSLNQLQSIRESLMQMKSPANQNFTALNTMVSAFVFPFHDKIPLSDCPPSLPSSCRWAAPGCPRRVRRCLTWRLVGRVEVVTTFGRIKCTDWIWIAESPGRRSRTLPSAQKTVTRGV